MKTGPRHGCVGYSVIACTLAAVAGCGGTRNSGIQDVQHTISDRTGQQIHWNLGGPDDAAVALRVHQLLGTELTATSAVQIALLNNRTLQMTYEDLGIARADLVRAGLLRNPILDVDAKFAVGGGVRLEATIVEDFLSILYLPLHKRIAATEFEGVKLRIAGVVIDLCTQVRLAVYQYQMASQVYDKSSQDVAAAGAAYELALRLRAAGNITILDLAEQRDHFEMAKLSLNELELRVAEAREDLTSLLGLWGHDVSWSLMTTLPDLPATDPPFSDLEHQAIANSIDLSAIRSDIIVAAQQLGIAKPMEILEGSGVGAAAEREYDGVWGVGPYVSIPIPIFNMGQPAQLAAQSQLRRAEAEYYAQAVEIRNRVTIQWQRVASNRARVLYLQNVVIPLRMAEVEQGQLQYNGMLMSPFRLLQLKQGEIEARIDHDRALSAYWSARTMLDQLLEGRMSPSMIMRSNTGNDMNPMMSDMSTATGKGHQ